MRFTSPQSAPDSSRPRAAIAPKPSSCPPSRATKKATPAAFSSPTSIRKFSSAE
jgi:hypothetical protein